MGTTGFFGLDGMEFYDSVARDLRRFHSISTAAFWPALALSRRHSLNVDNHRWPVYNSS